MMAVTLVQVARIHQERGAEQPAGTFGAIPGTPVYLDQRILTSDVTGGPELEVERDASQQFGNTGTEKRGRRYRGTLTSKARVDELAQMLFYLFGKVDTTEVAGTPNAYDHVFTPLDDLTSVAPSFGIDLAIEKKRMYRYSGCLVQEVQISKVGAEEVAIVYTLVLKSRTTAAFPSHTPTYSTRAKLAVVNTATLHGQAITWESLTIRLQRNWDETMAFSADTLPDAEIGPMTGEIDGVVKFENANPNLVDAFEAETEGEFTIEFRGTQINSVPKYDTLMIECDRVKILDAPPPQIGPDRKTQSVRATILVPTSGDWIKCTVTDLGTTPADYP